jgi:hypothetical protein
MNHIIHICIFVFVLLGCKQEVNFNATDSTPIIRNPNANDNLAVEEPPSLSVQPPVINILKKPKDHLVDETTSIQFEIIKGDNPLDFIGCYLDKNPIACNFLTTLIEFKNLNLGEHIVSIKVTDNQNLSAQVDAHWKVFKHLISHTNDLKISATNTQTDILFVIDNSISMNSEQQGIADRISNFFDKITELDWRLGIITTDPYEFDPVSKIYNPLADGQLLSFSDGRYLLDSKLSDKLAKKMFSETIYRPEQGNGHERGIYNTYRSIERSQNPNTLVNQRLNDFYRTKAALAVVLISDENETLVNGINVPLADLDKSDGTNLISLVKNTWGAKKLFQFNSVIVRPNDILCIGPDEKYGYAYNDLSIATDGVVEDICAKDYSGALSKIGSEVANLQKRYTLDCLPLDTDGDGIANVDVRGSNSVKIPNYIISLDQIEFDKPLSEGNYQINYFCPK